MRAFTRCTSAWLSAFAGFGAQKIARADEPAHTRIQLIFEGTEDCPTRSSFESEVAARLGYSPFEREQPSTVAVALEKTADHASATLHVVMAIPDQGPLIAHEPARILHKMITSDKGDCAEVMRSAAASLAIFLDPLFSAPRTRVPVTTVPELPPSIATPPPEPTTKRVLSTLILGELSLTTGLLPAASFGGAVHIGLKRDWWLVMLGGEAETTLVDRTLATTAISGSFIAGELSACVHSAPFIACGEAALGRYHAEATGSGETTSASTVFPIAGLRAGVALPVGAHLGLWATPQLRVPLTEVSLLRAGEPVWTTAPLSVRLSVGLAWNR